MKGLIRCVLIAGVAISCKPGDIDSPDALVSGDSGLVVEWSSSPEPFPGTLGDGVVIERARFALESLRVVGDAGPGDPRTTVTGLVMGFNWSETGESPADITFDLAPLGLYSQVAIAFEGTSDTEGEAYEIRGTAVVNSEQFEFRIQDADPLAFNVNVDKMVSPGEVTIVHLRVNFTGALDAIDFTTLDINDGRLELEQGDAQMSAFRAKLQESFEIVNVTNRPLD